ncbi:MAG: hypothetical protein JJU02_00340 [Cryomorphaceae bacterium]|nr:hypothetical protein [Cryomorphaceae bacterium]
MKNLIILFLAFHFSTLLSQTKKTSWEDLITVSGDYYEFKVPERFRAYPLAGNNYPITIMMFDASGLELPYSHLDKLVFVTIYFEFDIYARDLEKLKKDYILKLKDNNSYEF